MGRRASDLPRRGAPRDSRDGAGAGRPPITERRNHPGWRRDASARRTSRCWRSAPWRCLRCRQAPQRCRYRPLASTVCGSGCGSASPARLAGRRREQAQEAERPMIRPGPSVMSITEGEAGLRDAISRRNCVACRSRSVAARISPGGCLTWIRNLFASVGVSRPIAWHVPQSCRRRPRGENAPGTPGAKVP